MDKQGLSPKLSTFKGKVVQTNPKHILIQKIQSLPIRGNGLMAMLLGRMLFPQIRATTKSLTLYGFEIWVHGNEDGIIERSVYYTGTYEKGTIHMMRQLLKEGDVFVDAGANIGMMSLAASGFVGPQGKVYAFEPFPKMYERFEENICLNQFKNITIYPEALAADAGEVMLYPDAGHNPGASSLIARAPGVRPVPVHQQRLDTYPFSTTNIKLLKIDVEGYEMEVLKGATGILTRSDAPAIIVECSRQRENHQYTAEGLFAFIRGINAYRVFKLKRGKTHISELVEVNTAAELPDHDNLFCFLPTHLNTLQHD